MAAPRNAEDAPASDVEAKEGWQERAMSRAMADARTRALARSSKLMTSALELLEETGSVEFTVQNLVERSELSLRAFYQHFSSKDELLLALFEELLAQFVESLQAEVEGIDDPYDRLEAYVRGFLQRSHESLPVGGRAWTIYQLRLAVDRPDEYSRAFGPQVDFLASLVHHGVTRGVFRTDLSEPAVTLLLNSTLVSVAQMDVFDTHPGGSTVTADEVWEWCRTAVTPPRAAATKTRSRRG